MHVGCNIINMCMWLGSSQVKIWMLINRVDRVEEHSLLNRNQLFKGFRHQEHTGESGESTEAYEISSQLYTSFDWPRKVKFDRCPPILAAALSRTLLSRDAKQNEKPPNWCLYPVWEAFGLPEIGGGGRTLTVGSPPTGGCPSPWCPRGSAGVRTAAAGRPAAPGCPRRWPCPAEGTPGEGTASLRNGVTKRHTFYCLFISVGLHWGENYGTKCAQVEWRKVWKYGKRN